MAAHLASPKAVLIMIPGARCKTCAFWVKRPGNVYGQCYRLPPRPDVITVEGERVQADVRPLVKAEEWCGEYRPAPQKTKPTDDAPKGVRLVQ